MKVRSLLLFLCTVLLAWFLPTLYSMFSSPVSGRFMVYFSSVTQHFCSVEKDSKTDKIIRKDVITNEQYSLNQFDSILPLLYYRQLLADGKMPDTIQGKRITIKETNQKSFFFRHKARDKNSPSIPLYLLFESESGRVDLKMPNDVFRINKRIEFINPETNKIDLSKTKKFTKTFNERHFVFPAKLVAGNPSVRKPYDEGYFVIDAENNLFHFKMIKSEPYLKKVVLPEGCLPTYFSSYEPDDRSFYGFVFDQKGFAYVLKTDNYKLQKLDCGQINLDKQILTVMGNPLYWTVRVISREKEDVFAFDAETKQKVAQHHFEEEQKPTGWNKYLFPFELKWMSPLSRYVIPKFSWGYPVVLVLNLLCALLFFFGIRRKVAAKVKLTDTLWILFTGIFGFIVLIFLYEKE